MTRLPPDGGPDGGRDADWDLGWDDARLDAAFAARAATTPEAPSDLVSTLSDRLAARDRRVLPWRWAVAAVAVVSVAVVVGGSVLLRTPQPSQTIPPAAASSLPSTAAPSPSPDTAVIDALGDPVSVTAALAIRDAATGADRELLVSGFLSPVPIVYCAIEFGPRNPTHPRCPEHNRWLMEEKELQDPQAWHAPTGPAFHPSFAIVKTPDVRWPETGPATPLPVVLLGHFHDRRAQLCPDSQRQDCEQVFLVDRVVSIDGVEQPIESRRQTDAVPIELSRDVDALVAGEVRGAVLASRQILPLDLVFDVEPALRADISLTNFSPASITTWLETVVDLRAGIPVARTFMLLDGTSWFAEVTAGGARLIERTVQAPSGGGWPAMPSGDPTAFASAPSSVLGIPVRSIGALQADRQAAMDELGRDEMAVRAWYLGPAPGATCDEPPPAIHPPTPPCDAARHWLLDDPQQFGLQPGQLRADPTLNRWAPVLNPLVPIDVPFDPGATWRDDTPAPVPVVVLGHFADHRVRTYAGDVYFVIDALAWTRDGPAATLDSVVRLTTLATEEPASVLARIDAMSPNASVATWATVIDAADFPGFDRYFEPSTEFATGTPVWIVRRLVPGEMDGRQRLAIEWTWTQDGGTRVWWTETPDSGPDLGTTLDLHDLDANTSIVQVVDYDGGIESVAPATGLGSLDWRQPLGNATDFMDVARGRTSHELVLRWSGPACAASWKVKVRVSDDGAVFLSPTTQAADCAGADVVRRIVMVFDRAIDIDRVEGPSCCG